MPLSSMMRRLVADFLGKLCVAFPQDRGVVTNLMQLVSGLHSRGEGTIPLALIGADFFTQATDFGGQLFIVGLGRGDCRSVGALQLHELIQLLLQRDVVRHELIALGGKLGSFLARKLHFRSELTLQTVAARL